MDLGKIEAVKTKYFLFLALLKIESQRKKIHLLVLLALKKPLTLYQERNYGQN